MPPHVKREGSVIILSTLLTSLLVGVLLWGGTTILGAYTTSVEMPYIKTELTKVAKSLEDLDNKNSAVLGYIHDAQLERQILEFKLEACKEGVEFCKTRHP